ncbi:hypothetical protein DM02DRAFT_616014 [Periconia macrospinosa]|uniref:Uncharacterized protein n=1 Tax=Periconia macrospinosa TaxID=97972 RepID=A0A2V1DIZ8_9PLEO|nr:hypothetical protein DM02DRAFT_616014 [Periconia macrospinosa]
MFMCCVHFLLLVVVVVVGLYLSFHIRSFIHTRTHTHRHNKARFASLVDFASHM